MNVLKCISRLFLLMSILLLSNQFSFGQDDKFNLRFDTLSADEALKIQRDFFSLTLKFDSTIVELFYKGERFAIVHGSLIQHVNRKFIKSSEFKTETWNDNRTLLRIQLQMSCRPE